MFVCVCMEGWVEGGYSVCVCVWGGGGGGVTVDLRLQWNKVNGRT